MSALEQVVVSPVVSAVAEGVKDQYVQKEFIESGDQVMITGGSVTRMISVRHGAKTKLSKVMAELGSLIGIRYGADVELNEKSRKFETSNLNSERKDQVSTAAAIVANSGDANTKKDNRFLEDKRTGEAQKLDEDGIRNLRQEEGMKNIVDKLVEGSATFENKTAFAQEKYLRKKNAKYALLYRVDRVTITNYSDLKVPTNNPDFMEGGPDDSKALQLRVDAIAQMLHYGNIKYNAQVMLVDDSNGLLPTSILSRMKDEGKIFQLFEGKTQPQFSFTKAMHLPSVKQRWKAVPLNPFLDPNMFPARTEEEKEAKDKLGAERKASNEQSDTVLGKAAIPGGETETGAWIGGRAARDLIEAQPPSSLMIANGDPLPMLKDLFPFLALSGSIALYCPSAEPLFKCFHWLFSNKEAVAIRVADTWYREYQVLPGRTHPTVTMSGTGGYILSAIKVQKRPDEPVVAVPAVAAPSAPSAETTEDQTERGKRDRDTEAV